MSNRVKGRSHESSYVVTYNSGKDIHDCRECMIDPIVGFGRFGDARVTDDAWTTNASLGCPSLFDAVVVKFSRDMQLARKDDR